MSKIKKNWITFISLMSALFLLFGLAFGLPKISASANTYAPSTVFSSGTGGTVGASKLSTEGNKKTEYVQFTFSDDGNVYFRRDLALRWYAEETTGTGTSATKEVKTNYFSMQLAFLDVTFSQFTIAFESGEENITKESKAINKLVFKPVVEGAQDKPDQVDEPGDEPGEEPKEEEPKVYPTKIKVYVVNADEVDNEEDAIELDATKDILITIDEAECEIGEFSVYVKNVEAPKQEENKDENKNEDSGAAGAALEEGFVGKFTNIGGYFLDYRSASSTTPNTPITFTAEIPDSEEEQLVLMRSLNKQSMALNSSNRVDDNAPAVLVLNEDLYAFKLGKKFSLSYEAIDVCDDNVTVTREYYMLKTEKDESGNPVYYMPNEKAITAEDDDRAKYNYKGLTTYTYFLPTQENPNQEEYVSIRFKLDDDTDENDTYVLLSWYANSAAKKPLDCTGYEEFENQDGTKDIRQIEGTREFTFIKVNRDDEGPHYKYLEAKKAESDAGKNENVVTNDEFHDAVSAYQRAVNERAEATSAGTGAYIYLPSLRDLIASKNAGYRNLKFSVYYYKPGSTGASSQTSLSYNALKLEVDKEGDYRFRVIAQDASSNAMKYYDEEGELVTVTSNNVWDIEGIPEFTFHISYSGPTIEDPEEQSLGYKNDRYSFEKFKIIALSGYQTEYTLYRYDELNATTAGVSKPTYSDFVKNASTYFEQFSELDEALTDKTKKILYEISTYQSDVTEDDEAKWNRTDNDYHWDPDSSLSFIPQQAGFYVLKLVVEDYNYPGETAVQYQVIEVRNPIDKIPGQSQWLRENVVSVVLFSISGVLAIVVVVLFLVKPSEKRVEEIDLEKLKGKKKNKK